MSRGINLLLIPFAVKCKHHTKWGVTPGEQHTYCLYVITFHTELQSCVKWWGEVTVMGRANLKTACMWFLNIFFVWRLCETLHCLMIYHFTVNLSSGKYIHYARNLYSLGIYLWVYYTWCIIMFLIMLIKWQRLCNIKWDTKTAINIWQESYGILGGNVL
jgi:hypothetical protein